MSKKAVDVLYPAGFVDDVTKFISGQYEKSRDDLDLPNVRNNHEAYGIMAEKFQNVSSFTGVVKSSVGDALATLPNSQDGFVSTVEMAYTGCVEVAKAAIDMAIAMQNIVTQRAVYEGQTADKTPLEVLSEGVSGDVEILSDDDEDDDYDDEE